MKALREQPEHSLDRFGVGVRADLQRFVMIDGLGIWHQLFPSVRVRPKPRRERRLSLRFDGARRFARSSFDLPLELFVVWKSRELVDADHRLLRRVLDLFPARLAHHLVVETEQIVAQFSEFSRDRRRWRRAAADLS